MTLKLNTQGERKMGLTHVAVELRKFDAEDGITIEFLVDTGAMPSMAPANHLTSLGIKPVGKKLYELANGELVEFEHGQVEMRFLNEIIPVQILFGPDGTEPILGVVALETAGFIVDPTSQTLKKLNAVPLKSAAASK